jgi:glycerol-1-phosphate dehydrogenase [NAD(P)+]
MGFRFRDFLGSAIPCGCGAIHRITTRRVFVGHDAAPLLAESLDSLCARGPGVVVADSRTFEAAAGPVLKRLDALRRDVKTCVLPDSADGLVHADEETLEMLLRAVPPRAAFVLAVGSGTINDLCKAAAGRRDVPCAVFATAASMNGYTSSIASIARKGLKTTAPAALPLVVGGDPQVLAEAPRRMAAAGLADLLSKTLSTADWEIGCLLSGGTVCPTSVEFLEDAVEGARGRAAGIKKGDPESVKVLFEGLLLSGFSMTVAGSSAPASGGEHLISHALDLTAPYEERKAALHGEQVGLGSVISAGVYERLLRQPLPRRFPRRLTKKRLETRIRALALDLPARIRAVVLSEGARKLGRVPPAAVRKAWPGILETAGRAVKEWGRSRAALEAAGTPLTCRDLGFTRDQVRRAALLAPWIRDRYTVLDLAETLGLLEEWVEEILKTHV